MAKKASQDNKKTNWNMHLGWEICRVLSDSDLKLASMGLLKLIQKTLKPANSTLIVLDPQTNKPMIRAKLGQRERTVRFYDKNNGGKAFNIGESVAEVAEEGLRASLIDTAIKNGSLVSKEEDDHVQIGSTLSVPLISKERLVGVLNLITTRGDSIKEDMKEALFFSSDWIADRIEAIITVEAYKKENGRIKEMLEEKERVIKEANSLLKKVKDALKTKDASIQEMEKQLVEVKHFSESVLQSLSSGIISVDRDGKISYMNKGAEKILNLKFQEMVGKPMAKVFTIKEKDLGFSTVDHLSEDQALGRQKTLISNNELEIPIGFTVSSRLDPIGNEIGKIIHFRDLTEIDKMQEEILRMDRLLSLGEISMGIAHEIRNPLAGIRITAQAMEEELHAGDPKKEYMIRIISEIDRLNDLLKCFFSFARPENPNPSFCHIQEIIQEVYSLIQKDLRDRGIDFIQDYGEGVPRLKVDFNQMKQVFLNLFLNSIHAMPQGGLLRIACSLEENSQAKDNGKKHVEITVSDTGKGIDKDNVLRIFDPFFTTKAKGLGLGLSITYRIINRHNGTMTVKTKKDEGTIFFIKLSIEYEGDYFI